ncbi:MAG TPA: hypothetical protein PKK00_13705 [Bacteroidales bacterium]|nr:hypothetical protein [Bacteroidales bacterium]HPS18244.1 hypothetical protein [Bacteroidales bacterium]
MKFNITLLLIFVCSITFGQLSINKNLKKQLDSLIELDQKYRELFPGLSDSLIKDSLASAYNVPFDEIEKYLWKLQTDIDSANLVFIEKVFAQYGYPGKSIVGIEDESNEVAWYIIQHSSKKKIMQYLDMIKKAGKQKELPYHLVAMMEDRCLMSQKKKQIYGSQATCRVLKNSKKECFIWPIRNPKKVNKRRTKAGFETSVEQNAKRLNVEYRIVKLSEIQK